MCGEEHTLDEVTKEPKILEVAVEGEISYTGRTGGWSRGTRVDIYTNDRYLGSYLFGDMGVISPPPHPLHMS